MSVNVIRSKIVIANKSYVEPIFRTSYIQVKVFAEVTFPDVLAVDIVTPTDLVSLSTNKTLVDSTNSLIDKLIKSLGKGNVDSLTSTDAISLKSFGKALADSQGISEAKAISTAKRALDAISPADSPSFRAIKSLADSVSLPVEVVKRVINKALSDSVTLTDVASAFKLYIRTYADSLTTPDSVKLLDTPATKVEVAITTDASNLSTTKKLTEGLNLHDDMDGILDFAFVKLVSELLTSADLKTIVFTGQKADNIAISSNGVLSMQDYSDITYFLEDYVGISRTFT